MIDESPGSGGGSLRSLSGSLATGTRLALIVNTVDALWTHHSLSTPTLLASRVSPWVRILLEL